MPRSGAGSPASATEPHHAAHRGEQILRSSVLQSRNAPADWSTIDWMQAGEAAQLNVGQAKAKSRFGDHEFEAMFSASQGWLAAVISGILMGLMAVMIEIGTVFVSTIRVGVCSGYFWLNRELCCPQGEEDCDTFVTWGELLGGPAGRHRFITSYVMYVLLGTFFAGTAAVLCKNFAMYAAGGGVNEVKTVVSGHLFSRYFSRTVTFIKAVTVCMSTGSGLAVGKEGPFVHLGACAADIVGALFPTFQTNPARRRELISAGAGGGLAVAFGAPIGGVLFAIEEISSFFSFRTMMQSLMFGVTAVLVVKNFDTMHTGRIVQFSIDYRHRWHWFELPLFALLGAFGGLVGSLYNVCNMWVVKYRKTHNLRFWPITEVICLAIISNMLNFVVPFSKASMLSVLAEVFQDCTSESSLEVCQGNDLGVMFWLCFAACIKVVLSFCTVGSCVPAGLLVPSLAIGGLFGRAFGILVSNLQQQYPTSAVFQECSGLNLCVIPGAYAIVGSAAVLTGVTRMTVCLAVIMFELTGGLEYLVPVIVAILMSKWVGEALGVECIFELGIEAGGLPYLDPKKEFQQPYVTSDIFGDKPYKVVYTHGMTLNELNDLLESNDFHGFPMVASPTDNSLLGYVRRARLIDALHATARSRMRDVTMNTQVRFTDTPLEAEVAADAAAVEAAQQNNDDGAARAARRVPAVAHELDFSGYVDESVLQVAPDCTIARLLYMFKSLGARHILVSRFSRFVGLVTKKDLIQFMRKLEHEEHEEEEELVHSVKAAKHDKHH
jgi:chloride channel 3/4/5